MTMATTSAMTATISATTATMAAAIAAIKMIAPTTMTAAIATTNQCCDITDTTVRANLCCTSFCLSQK